MLMYGDPYNIIDSGNVYNLNSLKEGYPNLFGLLPPQQAIYLNGRDFDISYMNYIFGNDMVFVEFFKIIYDLYLGIDVYLIINSGEDWTENLAESLVKLIQQRYGYNAVRINCQEDYLYMVNSSNIPEFNQYFGINNFNIDRDRYTNIIQYMKLKSGERRDI